MHDFFIIYQSALLTIIAVIVMFLLFINIKKNKKNDNFSITSAPPVEEDFIRKIVDYAEKAGIEPRISFSQAGELILSDYVHDKDLENEVSKVIYPMNNTEESLARTLEQIQNNIDNYIKEKGEK